VTFRQSTKPPGARDGDASRFQTIGLRPHRISLNTRAPRFFDKARFGRILCDIASHQAGQCLFFTNSTMADVVA